MPDLERGPSSEPGSIMPRGRVSAPEYVDWHMILDQELDQLSNLQTGVLGGLGFTALGATLGVAPSFVVAISKASAELARGDVTAMLIFVASLVAAVICLSLYFLSRRKTRSLPETIRARNKIQLGRRS